MRSPSGPPPPFALDTAERDRGNHPGVTDGSLCSRLLAEEVVCDVPHNFARLKAWGGRTLLVHRKGAIGLDEGALGLVPGSTGTTSYLVEGRASVEAFGSCSHGAGRVLSRSEAHRSITMQALRRSMGAIVYPERLAAKLVGEAPAAYREIRGVLDAQKDLVRRGVRLEPVAVMKGA